MQEKDKPKFKVGDRVLVTGKDSILSHQLDGKVATVDEVGKDFYSLNGECGGVHPYEVSPVEEARPTSVTEFKPGDRITDGVKNGVVISIPGMPQYDRIPFIKASEGVVVRYDGDSSDVWRYKHKLTLIKETSMNKKTFTNSQKIRLRLKTYWDKHDTDYNDFEDFYTAFTNAVLDNLEFLAETFKI